VNFCTLTNVFGDNFGQKWFFSAIPTKSSVLMALFAINIEIIPYPALCLFLIFNFKYKA
jgi:hypothetical protein